MEENGYYPFGEKHGNYNAQTYRFTEDSDGISIILAPTVVPYYQYKFNGQERQDEFGLNVTAMDFRQYDSAIGRFNTIDVLSELDFDKSQYGFARNNPVALNDPSGFCPECDDYNVNDETDQYLYLDHTFEMGFLPASFDGGFAPMDGQLNEVKIIGKGYNNREDSYGSGDLLDFNLKLIDRFKKSGIDPNARAEQTPEHITAVIRRVKGLEAYWKRAGSPNSIEHIMGRSSEGARGKTIGTPDFIELYNGAFENNYWLASTLFHEITHAYTDIHLPIGGREAERIAYSVEWRLGNHDPSIWKQIQLNQPFKY